jgi:type II secretion system protein I
MIRRHIRQAGFTLIEVIVALAILSVAVVAAIQGFAQGLRLLKLAGDHQHATLLADQKAREIVTPTAGATEGTDDRGFTWHTVTTEVQAPDLARDGARAPAWRVFQIAVTVRWDEHRAVELMTLRTAPADDLEATDGPPRTQRSGVSRTGPPPGPPVSRRR